MYFQYPTTSKHGKKGNDVLAAELTKKTKLIDKWKAVSERNMLKEEQQMKMQLKKLEEEKLKYNTARLCESDAKRKTHLDDDKSQVRSHSGSHDNQAPGTFKYKEKYAKRVEERLQKHGFATPRSHRQLRQEYVTSEKNHRLPDPIGSPTSKASKAHKSLPVDASFSSDKTPSQRKKSTPADASLSSDRTPSQRKKSMPADASLSSGRTPSQRKKSMPADLLRPIDEMPFPRKLSMPSDSFETSYKTPSYKRPSLPVGFSTGPPVIVVTDEDNHASLPIVFERPSQEDISNQGDDLAATQTENESPDDNTSSLYEMAIQTVATAEDSAFRSVQDDRRRGSLVQDRNEKIPDTKQMDLLALKELEKLLQEARHFSSKRKRESDYGLQTGIGRGQQRRLQFLDEILQTLSGKKKSKFDAREILSCGYLRLSKTNIETLEGILREKGIEPGIHAHSDVSDYNVWDDIHKEQEEEVKRRESLAEDVKPPDFLSNDSSV